MNPLFMKWGSIGLAALGVVMLIGGSIVGIYRSGVNAGEAKVRLEYSKQEEKLRLSEQRITEAVAAAIAKIEVRHTTIRQIAEKEIIREERYRECVHTPAVLRLLNNALENRDTGEGVDSGSVPGSDRPEG